MCIRDRNVSSTTPIQLNAGPFNLADCNAASCVINTCSLCSEFSQFLPLGGIICYLLSQTSHLMSHLSHKFHQPHLSLWYLNESQIVVSTCVYARGMQDMQPHTHSYFQRALVSQPESPSQLRSVPPACLLSLLPPEPKT